MIPYLGSEFVRALLGLDACDGAAEAPLDLDSGEPLVTPAKMKAQSADRRYTAMKPIPNGDKPSSLPESKGEIGRPAANKATLSEWVDPDINACCFLDSDSLGITPGDQANPETLTTSHRARSIVCFIMGSPWSLAQQAHRRERTLKCGGFNWREVLMLCEIAVDCAAEAWFTGWTPAKSPDYDQFVDES